VGGRLRGYLLVTLGLVGGCARGRAQQLGEQQTLILLRVRWRAEGLFWTLIASFAFTGSGKVTSRK
jgi:hypothetical protein